MDTYLDSIRGLPTADKLRLVEQIWDDIASSSDPLPLPEWALAEAARRRDAMLADPELGDSHEDVWKRLDARDD